MAQKSAHVYANDLIFAVCRLAGSSAFLQETEGTEDQYSLRSVIQQHDGWCTPLAFREPLTKLQIATSSGTGLPSWAEIEIGLEMQLVRNRTTSAEQLHSQPRFDFAREPFTRFAERNLWRSSDAPRCCTCCDCTSADVDGVDGVGSRNGEILLARPRNDYELPISDYGVVR